MAGEKRRAILKWAAWALVLVVVVYPLSFGPLIYLDIRGAFREESEESLFDDLYAPCGKLYYSSSVYESYIGWWVTSALEAETDDFLKGESD